MPPIPELEKIRIAQILDAGLIAITSKGAASTTMDDVCRIAGLSKGGLVHYYKTKRDLFTAVFKEYFKRIFERSAETMAQFDDALDQILSYDWLYDKEDPLVTTGYPLILDFMSLSAHDEEYRLIMEEWINNWVMLLSAALEKGIEQGTFKQMDVNEVAKSISAIYQGIATRWYIGRNTHTRQWAINTYRRGIMGILSPFMA